jgi:hypothetical protein
MNTNAALIPRASPGSPFIDPYTQFASINTPAERHEMVARAAYCLAQRRGFAPGHELADWLQAERQLDAACGLLEPCPRWDHGVTPANGGTA